MKNVGSLYDLSWGMLAGQALVIKRVLNGTFTNRRQVMPEPIIPHNTGTHNHFEFILCFLRMLACQPVEVPHFTLHDETLPNPSIYTQKFCCRFSYDDDDD